MSSLSDSSDEGPHPNSNQPRVFPFERRDYLHAYHEEIRDHEDTKEKLRAANQRIQELELLALDANFIRTRKHELGLRALQLDALSGRLNERERQQEEESELINYELYMLTTAESVFEKFARPREEVLLLSENSNPHHLAEFAANPKGSPGYKKVLYNAIKELNRHWDRVEGQYNKIQELYTDIAVFEQKQSSVFLRRWKLQRSGSFGLDLDTHNNRFQRQRMRRITSQAMPNGDMVRESLYTREGMLRHFLDVVDLRDAEADCAYVLGNIIEDASGLDPEGIHDWMIGRKPNGELRPLGRLHRRRRSRWSD